MLLEGLLSNQTFIRGKCMKVPRIISLKVGDLTPGPELTHIINATMDSYTADAPSRCRAEQAVLFLASAVR